MRRRGRGDTDLHDGSVEGHLIEMDVGIAGSGFSAAIEEETIGETPFETKQRVVDCQSLIKSDKQRQAATRKRKRERKRKRGKQT